MRQIFGSVWFSPKHHIFHLKNVFSDIMFQYFVIYFFEDQTRNI